MPSPGCGNVADLDGDGIKEVVLDETENYVFFYASGVRRYQTRVMRWDGSRLVEVKLAKLADSAPAELKRLSDRAVDLANAGLWKEAMTLADQIVAQGAMDQTAKWNAILIRLSSQGAAEQARRGPYPILDNVFYGDYAVAVNVMRKYSPSEVFDKRSPPVVGTSAEQFQESLVKWSVESTTKAIQLEPNLAEAYFIRGWARNLEKPGSAAALADVKKAAELVPSDQLFTASARFLAENK